MTRPEALVALATAEADLAAVRREMEELYERDGHIGREIAEEFADRLQEAHGRCFNLRLEMRKLV